MIHPNRDTSHTTLLPVIARALDKDKDKERDKVYCKYQCKTLGTLHAQIEH